MTSFKILPGLPTYGPLAKSFPISGYGFFREGFVVQFDDENAGTWVGNFQPGRTRCSNAFAHPDGSRVVVVAGGRPYIVSPGTQTVEELGGEIDDVLVFGEDSSLLCNERFRLSFIGLNKAWRTADLS